MYENIEEGAIFLFIMLWDHPKWTSIEDCLNKYLCVSGYKADKMYAFYRLMVLKAVNQFGEQKILQTYLRRVYI